MDELDAALLEAWAEVQGRKSEVPAGKLGAYLSRPLRSWSVVLRANDPRLGGGEHIGHVRFDADGPWCELEELQLWGCEMKWLCAPIRIGPPGVPLVEAARRLGVGVNTIRRYEQRGLVSVRRFGKRARLKKAGGGRKNTPTVRGDASIATHHRASGERRNDRGQIEDVRWCPYPRRFPTMNYCLMTTNGWIDPGGEVWAGPWGTLRRMVIEDVADDFEQRLRRAHRPVGRQRGMWQWQCPGCGRWCYKLYWPMPTVTIQRRLDCGSELRDEGDAIAERGFSCRRCAKLVYESVERTGQAVDVWGRFVQRISEGVLRGRDVNKASSV